MIYVRGSGARNPGAVVMPLDAFKAVDYGRACAMLGLRPSEPFTRADGSQAKRPRRRRRRGTS